MSTFVVASLPTVASAPAQLTRVHLPRKMELPTLPTKLTDFISHFEAEKQHKPIPQVLEPFLKYEARLREIYAQEPLNALLQDAQVNTVPLFAGHEHDLKISARNPASETEEERGTYVLPLNPDDRRKDGTPAIVSSIKEFKHNFNLFSEQSLTDIDWDNVVACGSSVTTSLLPVPEKYAESKRALRYVIHLWSTSCLPMLSRLSQGMVP